MESYVNTSGEEPLTAAEGFKAGPVSAKRSPDAHAVATYGLEKSPTKV